MYFVKIFINLGLRGLVKLLEIFSEYQELKNFGWDYAGLERLGRKFFFFFFSAV